MKEFELSPIPPFRGSEENFQTSVPSPTLSSSISLHSQDNSYMSSSPPGIQHAEPRHFIFTPILGSTNEHQVTFSTEVPLSSLNLNLKDSDGSDGLDSINNYPRNPDSVSPPSAFVQKLQEDIKAENLIDTLTNLPGENNENNRTNQFALKNSGQSFSPIKAFRDTKATTSHKFRNSRCDAHPSGSNSSYLKQYSRHQPYSAALQQAVNGTSSTNLPPNSFLNSEIHLTPPTTPNSREKRPNSNKKGRSQLSPAFRSSSSDPRFPLTPRTSPYNQISPKCPQLTSSAKTLNSHKLDADFRENFVLGDELGCGGFGFVVRATRIKDGLSCAVKFIYKEKIPSHGWVQDDYRRGEEGSNYNKRAFGGNKMIPLEAYVLKKINHRGVVRFVDLYEDSKLIYLVMEHHGTPWAVVEKENKGKKISPSNLGGKVPTISSLRKSPLQPSTNEVINTTSPKSVNFNESIVFGESSIHSGAQQSQLYAPIPPITRRSSCDLFECIELHSRLPEKHAKFIFAQLVDIVGNLHYNGFVHRDIKDENIVVDQNFRVKLIDFGSALTFDFSREISPVKKFYGTMNFASPEIAVGGFYHPIAAEVWSLGVLLSILVCGESVFRDLDSIKAYNPARPKFPISESCMDLISRCLALAPEKRWNCFKIRSHPWLADCGWDWSKFPYDASTESVTRVRKF